MPDLILLAVFAGGLMFWLYMLHVATCPFFDWISSYRVQLRINAKRRREAWFRSVEAEKVLAYTGVTNYEQR